jgi:multicomponent Na+:H+ antiporter subunit B
MSERDIAFFLVNVVLLTLVTITGIVAIRVRSLLSATLMTGIYSLLMCLVWTHMDAMDVAFTEASVGAGISTILLLGALLHVGTEEKPGKAIHWPALVVVTLLGGALIYGSLDFPPFGDAKTPTQLNPVSMSYIKQDCPRVPDWNGHHKGEVILGHGDYYHGHCPNFVTSVIVSYRGYDTMYETTVIFIAGMSMILFLRKRRKPA